MKANKTSDPEDLALMTKLASASKLQPCEDTFPFPVPSRAIKTRATAEARSKKRPFCKRLPILYKPLPTGFRRDGFNYRQIAREGDATIYEQTWGSCSNPSVCYEVIRIRCREGFQIDGRLVEPAEVYPGSDALGVDGFTFADKEAAFAKLREVAGT